MLAVGVFELLRDLERVVTGIGEVDKGGVAVDGGGWRVLKRLARLQIDNRRTLGF